MAYTSRKDILHFLGPDEWFSTAVPPSLLCCLICLCGLIHMGDLCVIYLINTPFIVSKQTK